jgi:hypothetical protein
MLFLSSNFLILTGALVSLAGSVICGLYGWWLIRRGRAARPTLRRHTFTSHRKLGPCVPAGLGLPGPALPGRLERVDDARSDGPVI